MKKPTHRHKPGFTLVELLVVILIIVAIAALSVLGLSKMRGAGDRAATIAVLRQLQMANFGYATDHNGKYVPLSSNDANNNPESAWHDSSVFLAYLTGDQTNLNNNQSVTSTVPLSILDPVVVRAKKRLYDKLFASYGYNVVAMPSAGPSIERCFKVSQVTNPTRTAAFITATDWIAKYEGRLLWKTTPEEGKTTDGKIAFRHGGKAIVVYYDGSTGFVTPEDFRNYDAKGGANNPFWKANF